MAPTRCRSTTSCSFAMFPNRQRGIGLIAAIFLIVVVASLAVGVASLVRSGAAGYVQDVLAYKAFLAADSGAQLSLNRVFAPEGTPSCSNRVFPFSEPGLEGCEATVSCSAFTVSGVTALRPREPWAMYQPEPKSPSDASRLEPARLSWSGHRTRRSEFAPEDDAIVAAIAAEAGVAGGIRSAGARPVEFQIGRYIDM